MRWSFSLSKRFLVAQFQAAPALAARNRALAIALTVFLCIAVEVCRRRTSISPCHALDRTFRGICGDRLHLWSALARTTCDTSCRLRSNARHNSRILGNIRPSPCAWNRKRPREFHRRRDWRGPWASLRPGQGSCIMGRWLRVRLPTNKVRYSSAFSRL